MGLNFFKKKPELQPYDITPTHTEAQERYKRQIAEAERRYSGQQPGPTAKAEIKPTEIKSISIERQSPAVQEKPVLDSPATPKAKKFGQTKNTNTIRFHNDFIAKLKELKAQDQTFEGYLKERLGV